MITLVADFMDQEKWLRAEWKTCANAALGGHLEILEWVRDNGCDWNEWTCSSCWKWSLINS